jgi:hypothetical protein
MFTSRHTFGGLVIKLVIGKFCVAIVSFFVVVDLLRLAVECAVA